MSKLRITAGLVALCTVFGFAGTASAKFNAEKAVAGSVEVEGTNTKFVLGRVKASCKKITGNGEVDEKAGKTSNIEAEDEPSSKPTKTSEFLDLVFVFDECKIEIKKGETTENETESSEASVLVNTKENSCQDELSQKEGEKTAKYSFRADTKGKACKSTIESGRFKCTIGLHAEKAGENENLSGFKMANIKAFESEITVGSVVTGIVVAGVTPGCKYTATEEKEIKEGKKTEFVVSNKIAIKKAEIK